MEGQKPWTGTDWGGGSHSNSSFISELHKEPFSLVTGDLAVGWMEDSAGHVVLWVATGESRNGGEKYEGVGKKMISEQG